jgi:hypothetical protein
MAFNNEQLNDIFDRTDGRCHLCHKKLTFKNYGQMGERGAWEVEHSNPRARGGTNRLNNLYPACIACNRSKGAGSTKAARARNGKTRAPMSAAKKESARQTNAAVGAILGGALGALAGKKEAVAGAIVGAIIGQSQNPED